MRIETIENILDDFNFVRVNQAMEALDWQWALAEDGVPSMGELRRQARELLEGAYHQAPSPYYSVGTGGFEATRTMETGDLNKYLSLKFVVSEWNNYD
jgi:hypothetical protein